MIRFFLLGSLAVLLAASVTVGAQLSDVTQPGDPIVPSSNNSPLSEGAANAIDNQPTKYLNFDNPNPSLLWTTVSTATIIVNGQNVVTNPLSSPRKFYRLIQ